MPESSPPRFSRLAVASLILGFLTPCLQILAGLPALLLGFYGIRQINASAGQLRGQRMAVSGMILGSLGVALSLLWLLVSVFTYLTENSNRLQCSYNLSQIGLAVNLYHDHHDNHFPPGTLPAHLPPEKRLSWFAGILPEVSGETPVGRKWQALAKRLEQRQSWDAASNAPVAEMKVQFLQCPAQMRSDAGLAANGTSYVGVAGINPEAALLPPDHPRAGFFGYNRTISRANISAGISFTMMATETTQHNGPWIAGGPATVRGLEPEETLYIGPGRPFGGLHRDLLNTHQPGLSLLNVLWADLSVRPVGGNISPGIFRAQATLSGLRQADDGK